MIDWLDLRVPGCDLPVDAGKVVSFSSHGEIEWQTMKRLPVEGSHCATVTLRQTPLGLLVSGNPSKWFQGHNLFGTDDLQSLVPAFLLSIFDRVGYVPPVHERFSILRGVVQLTRLDTTQSYDLGNQSRAIAFVQALSQVSRLRHRGAGSILKEGTCYWRQGSRRMSAKAYCKGLELKAHPIPGTVPEYERLSHLALGLVRLEFTLRSMWLKHEGLDLVRNWPIIGATPECIHARLLSGLNIAEAEMIDTTVIEGLPPRYQLAYEAWLAGKDMRRMFSRNTFYVYRRALLAHGIDISIKRPSPPVSNVVRIRPILEAVPVGVPDWARGTSLYYEPQAVAA